MANARQDAAHTFLSRVKDGDGLDGLRQFLSRDEPRAAHTKCVHAKAILSTPLAKRIEDLEPKLMGVEGHISTRRWPVAPSTSTYQWLC